MPINEFYQNNNLFSIILNLLGLGQPHLQNTKKYGSDGLILNSNYIGGKQILFVEPSKKFFQLTVNIFYQVNLYFAGLVCLKDFPKAVSLNRWAAILLKNLKSDTNFIKNVKNQPYQLQ
jgi:hypothetical protein